LLHRANRLLVAVTVLHNLMLLEDVQADYILEVMSEPVDD